MKEELDLTRRLFGVAGFESNASYLTGVTRIPQALGGLPLEYYFDWGIHGPAIVLALPEVDRLKVYIVPEDEIERAIASQNRIHIGIMKPVYEGPAVDYLMDRIVSLGRKLEEPTHPKPIP